MLFKVLQSFLGSKQTPDMAYRQAVEYTTANLRELNRKYELYLMAEIAKLEARIAAQPPRGDSEAIPQAALPADEGPELPHQQKSPLNPIVMPQVEPVSVRSSQPLEPPIVTLIPTLSILVKPESKASPTSDQQESEEEEDPVFTRYSNLLEELTKNPHLVDPVKPAPTLPDTLPNLGDGKNSRQTLPKKSQTHRALVFVPKATEPEPVQPSGEQIQETAPRIKLVSFVPTLEEALPQETAEKERSWLPPPRFARFKPAPEKVVDETNPPATD